MKGAKRATEEITVVDTTKDGLSSTRRLILYVGVPMAILTLAALLMRAYRFGRDNIRCLHEEDQPGAAVCPMGGYAWERVGSNTLYALVWSSNKRWGNELSRYWQGRGMAYLGGLSFGTVGDFNHHWLKYLPKHVPAVPRSRSNCTQFALACQQCYDWKYSHKCLGAWTEIGNDIIHDTRHALEEWARINGREMPRLDRDDVVIQNRCSWDVWLHHPEYGPAAFSLYKNFPKTTKRIFIVADAEQTAKVPACSVKMVALHQTLRKWYPQATVEPVGGDVFTSFTMMVYAPLFVKDSSSFGLWAGMANNNTVVSPKLWAFVYSTFDNPHWQWSEAPVLYPEVAYKLNFTMEKLPDIIDWLQNN